MSFLNKTLLSTCLLAGALCTSPLAERHSAEAMHSAADPASAPVSAAQAAHDKAFPTPNQGLVLTQENCPSLVDLLNQFSAVTGEAVMYTRETKALLESRETGLQQDLAIGPADVYATVQDILVANRIVLTDMGRGTPRMLWVESADSKRRSQLREHARFVPQDQLEAYKRDSAILITTALHLPHSDTRNMTNSLRMMVVDANTTQIMAVRETNSVVLTGFGTTVNTMASLLGAMEESAAKDRARIEAKRQAAAESSDQAQAQEAGKAAEQSKEK